MVTYSVYIPNKEQEIIDIFNRLRNDGQLNEFVIRAVKATMPELTKYYQATAEREAKFWLEVVPDILARQDKLDAKRNKEMSAFIEEAYKVRVESDRSMVIKWFKTPAWRADWEAAGYKSLGDVVQAYQEYAAEQAVSRESQGGRK